MNAHRALVQSLRRSGVYPHPVTEVRLIETHISSVLLTGEYAYKIKKPLDLGFLDFSTLERRKRFCEEELRLNGRLAPEIYLDVVPITGSPESPLLGGQGEPFEYAIRMREFSQDDLLAQRYAGGKADVSVIEAIARRAAEFHAVIDQADADAPYGTPQAVRAPMAQNFEQIRPLIREPSRLDQLERLRVWTETRCTALAGVLAGRKADGHIRECHGDMHLGNIALRDGRVLIFDGIEFNPNLSWIDTINEFAFLLMDLDHSGNAVAARHALNVYLEATGDFSGLKLLRFYQVYRALVRAKVTVLRLAQGGLSGAEIEAIMAVYGVYADLAESYTRPMRGALVITHGVSGSGKTTLSAPLIEALPAVRIRSDVERKRLYGLAAAERSGSSLGGGIYGTDATRATYARLAELAGTIVEAGFVAVVDATFLKRGQRDEFRDLAVRLGAPFLILDCQADEAELRWRVEARAALGADASEAGAEVLEMQLQAREPLAGDEREASITLDASQPLPLDEVLGRIDWGNAE